MPKLRYGISVDQRAAGLARGCDLTRTNVKLGQVQVESVNLVGTKVADEKTRAIQANVAPPKGRFFRVSEQSFQIDEEF